MIISIRDSIKLLGISIVCFCAVFVCTFFLNFYLDVLPLKEQVATELMPLYDAQLATAQMCCAITGGVLALIAAIMIVFYIKLYIAEHAKILGTLKALGYSNAKLSLHFCIFGFSVLIGCILGYACGHAAMPAIYDGLAIDGLTIKINYHIELLFVLVFAPTALFATLSYVYAYISLRRPALNLIKDNRQQKQISNKQTISQNRPFLREMTVKTISANKSLTFFVTLSCFCFSAMIQMGWSMEDLVKGTMGWMITAIGIVLAATSIFMAMTALLKNNSKSISMLKTFGYSNQERFFAIFGGYIPFAILGFALGTGYQYGLLQLMVNVIFKNVGEVPEYSFHIDIFLITLALFLITYPAIVTFYYIKLNRISVKEIMLEN